MDGQPLQPRRSVNRRSTAAVPPQCRGADRRRSGNPPGNFRTIECSRTGAARGRGARADGTRRRRSGCREGTRFVRRRGCASRWLLAAQGTRPARGPQVLKEGEREKTKTYQAVVWVARPLTDADLQTLLAVLRAFRVSVDQRAHRRRAHANARAGEGARSAPADADPRASPPHAAQPVAGTSRASLGCSISVASQPA